LSSRCREGGLVLLNLQSLASTPYNQLALQFREIYPGVPEGIDVAIRFAVMTCAMGSAMPAIINLRKTGARSKVCLAVRPLHIQVSITHSGGMLTKNFLLRNEVPQAEFKLEAD